LSIWLFESGIQKTWAYIERNAIALGSNFDHEPLNPWRDGWLGTASRSTAIRQ